MTKVIFKLSIIILGLIISLNSCINGDGKPVADTEELEVIPENIVELREDQIKLAGIQTGAIELRSVSNTIKVNGIISVAPQNQATVSMPLGGFIKSTNLLPGHAVSKGQILAVIENQEFVDIQQSYLIQRRCLFREKCSTGDS
jgi:cobalt-zinc-cadmium efflux system membrane fusion protein